MSRVPFAFADLRPHPALQRRVALLGVLALAACSSVQRPPVQPDAPTPRPAPPPPAPPRPAAAGSAAPEPPPASNESRSALAAALAVEQKWLNSFFAGTPVQITQRDDGSLVVDVPLQFCFAAGDSAPKAPLIKVLDKVAESLRRRPAARLSQLAAPADPGGPAALGLQRAGRIQNHLRERGVARASLGTPSSTSVAAVQLRIGAAARPAAL
jgi:hypothetical protein